MMRMDATPFSPRHTAQPKDPRSPLGPPAHVIPEGTAGEECSPCAD